MLIFFAGGSEHPELAGYPILESFYYKKKALEAMDITEQFFLDSGAYSAWSSGKPIRLDDYAAFLEEHKGRYMIAANLDDITDAELTYNQQHDLLDRGHDVLPVFHNKDHIMWLERYLDEGFEHLCIGGIAKGVHRGALLGRLDKIWSRYLLNEDGTAKIKVHAFGLTTRDLLERYPWYSADSTTWMVGERFGQLLVNLPGRNMMRIGVTDRHPDRMRNGSTHVDRLTEIELAAVHSHVEANGFTLDEIRNGPMANLTASNIRTMIKWGESMQGKLTASSPNEMTLF